MHELGITMDFVLLELILWAGLAFFFWALKDNLGHVEADIDAAAALKRRSIEQARKHGFVRPEQVSEPIGFYQGCPIYRIVVVDGKSYQFEHVLPGGTLPAAEAGCCCVAPGLLYVACAAPGTPAA